MLIDWFTVGAQVVNFLILVWLMKRFLYQPVLSAIAAREQNISDELADAARTKAQAHQQQDAFEKKNQAFDEQRAALLSKAIDEANAERSRLLVEARKNAAQASSDQAKALIDETQRLHDDLVRLTQEQVYDISRRVLADLASVSLEQRACEVFIQRLRSLDDRAREALSTALKVASPQAPALLRSAFELPVAQQNAIQTAIDECFGQTIALEFQILPELVSGVALSVNGLKVAWSIADYLEAISTTLQARLSKTEPV
ncbi:ATP synthase F0 subcomplex B subunit [Pseudomonas graminis]|uniref:F0F1 ATP synthase subunit delta n=1 Tax=Pseudomonas graminis TaxID=158627 RepID=UPI00106075FC|nr:F0F1 ATP synthase subunit delta [Pseudomonas graminis]TDV50281.1 ATP synthase F0 subcomplex B subunit [Pseudomonas graminis]